MQRTALKSSGVHEPPGRASHLPELELPFLRAWKPPPVRGGSGCGGPAAPHGRGAGTAATQAPWLQAGLQDRRRRLTAPPRAPPPPGEGAPEADSTRHASPSGGALMARAGPSPPRPSPQGTVRSFPSPM